MERWHSSSIPPEVVALFTRIVSDGPQGKRPRWFAAKFAHYVKEISRRRRFMREYGWGVPTPNAIAAIRDFVGDRELLEIGAGNGLWAYLLSTSGISVTATDDYSWAAPPPGVKSRPPSGFPVDAGRFFPVHQLDATGAVTSFAGHNALLLCWPPYGRSMAFSALVAFQGDSVVYIGDKGCTGDLAFHNELDLHWLCQDLVQIPTWPGIHDAVYLYKRKVENWKPPGVGRRPNPHFSSMT